MKLVRTLVTALVLGIVAANNAPAAVSTPVNGDPEDLAKIARVRAQKNAKAGSNDRRQKGDPEECGSIDIGNSTGNSRRGGKTDVTVFIDGDVINAFNKCR